MKKLVKKERCYNVTKIVRRYNMKRIFCIVSFICLFFIAGVVRANEVSTVNSTDSLNAETVILSSNEVKNNESIIDRIWQDINIFKTMDLKSEVGCEIIKMDGGDDFLVQPSLKILESPKKYLNFCIVYPKAIGVCANLNLKKIGGDIYFKYLRKDITDEARQKIEERYKWLQWIRLDVGYFGGYYKDKWVGRFAVRVVEWNF